MSPYDKYLPRYGVTNLVMPVALGFWFASLLGIDVPALIGYALAFGFGGLLIGMLIYFPAMLIWAAVMDTRDSMASHLRKKG